MDIIVKNDYQSVSWKSPELLGIAWILTESFYSGPIDYLIIEVFYAKVITKQIIEANLLRHHDSMQCCKFLSPGCPRRSGLGLGDLLSDAGSPGGRPEMTISQQP